MILDWKRLIWRELWHEDDLLITSSQSADLVVNEVVNATLPKRRKLQSLHLMQRRKSIEIKCKTLYDQKSAYLATWSTINNEGLQVHDASAAVSFATDSSLDSTLKILDCTSKANQDAIATDVCKQFV